MRRTIATVSAILGAVVLSGVIVAASHAGAGEAEPAKVRLGTYDNRAIAMAFAASAYNPVKEKMAEMEKAKAEGDEAKVKELEHWGVTLQKKLHFQGFGHYPVDDLLANVADKIPGVAEKNHLDAIVWLCDYRDTERVEIVDVTKDLVALFDPPERVLNWIDQMNHPPVPFETLIDLPVDE